jgi:hypothetical protein
MHITALIPLFTAGAFAATCFQGPLNYYTPASENDLWVVRDTLCSNGGTCQTLGAGGNYSSQVCESHSGIAYGGFRVHDRTAHDAVLTCGVSSSPRNKWRAGDARERVLADLVLQSASLQRNHQRVHLAGQGGRVLYLQ